MAISCARRILGIVSGHHAPAFTVASLATITAGRPSMRANPGDHARAGRLTIVLVVGDQQPDLPETAMPGSISAAMRSRAVSFPSACCLSIFFAPPPVRNLSSSLCHSSTTARMCSAGPTTPMFVFRGQATQSPISKRSPGTFQGGTGFSVPSRTLPITSASPRGAWTELPVPPLHHQTGMQRKDLCESHLGSVREFAACHVCPRDRFDDVRSVNGNETRTTSPCL